MRRQLIVDGSEIVLITIAVAAAILCPGLLMLPILAIVGLFVLGLILWADCTARKH